VSTPDTPTPDAPPPDAPTPDARRPAPGADPSAVRPRIATVWMGGCSGCHMSFLDLDERLFDLAERADVVFSPLADVKDFPPDVDLVLVEGAVTNEDNLELAYELRANSRVVVSFGDCAVTGNVTALRNALGEPADLLRRVYVEQVDLLPVLPTEVVPALLPRALPLHEVIPVDVYLPGCPPSADRIQRAVFAVLDSLAAGEGVPAMDWRGHDDLRFG
jgi:NAD-reducing hydrogenase small subunit